MNFISINQLLDSLKESDLLVISKTIFNSYEDLISFDFITDCPNENPIQFIAQKYKEINGKKYDKIVAIGGGSILDLAKILSTTNSINELQRGIINKRTSLWVMPTTFATGSETSSGAIYKDEFGIKKGLRGILLKPDKVFYDVNLFKKLPKRIQKESFFDLFTHVYETSLSLKSSNLINQNSIYVISKLLIWFDEIQLDIFRFTNSQLEVLAKCSFISGENLKESTTCAPHRLQYNTCKYNNLNHSTGLYDIYYRWFPHSLDYITGNLVNDFNNYVNLRKKEIMEMISSFNLTEPFSYDNKLKNKILMGLDRERLINDPTLKAVDINEFLK